MFETGTFLQEFMEDCELVYHLAAQSNVLGAVQNLEYSFASNVVGTFNVLQTARQAGVQRMVLPHPEKYMGILRSCRSRSQPRSVQRTLTARAKPPEKCTVRYWPLRGLRPSSCGSLMCTGQETEIG